MTFQKEYELAKALIGTGNDDQIEKLVSPENLPQIMELLTIEVAKPFGVSSESDYEELPVIENAPHWPRYFEYLRTKKEPWSNTSLKSIDDSTKKVLEKMPRALCDSFNSTGLVVGHVQAGKTANYTGLIAKAADQGYNLFIIFTGTTNNLREQTQRRFEKELFGSDYIPESVSKPPLKHRWQCFTTGDDDFEFNLTPEHLIGSNPCIIIAKKFHTVLDKIVEFLNTADTEILGTQKLLLIDDEADYASINTLGDEDNENEEASEETKNATKTNEALRRIRNFFKSNVYVGYTATPFANVLIDPHYTDDELGKTLYPRDFIVALPQPEGYLGTDDFFPETSLNDGDEEPDKICIVPPNEAEIMREGGDSSQDNYGLPHSFLVAFIDFLLTGAAKSLRSLNNKHHTMLVQTHHEIDTHELTCDRISAVWENWKNDLILYSRKSRLIEDFEDRWTNEFAKSPEQWKDLVSTICNPTWLERVEIMTVNTDSEIKLDYTKEPVMVVVIGGFSLGRGLTLKGLTTSFFTRTSNNYDTLLQMGRWFGFRKGYEDLIRVHLTAERYCCFGHLAVVEEEIRFDIARYDSLGCTPMELSVRIQTHHTMKVTSSLKMGAVRQTQKGWSAATVQTLNYDLEKTDNMDFNLSHTDGFLWTLGKDFVTEDSKGRSTGCCLWNDVDSKTIIDFISEFRFGKNASNFDADEIKKYIERVNTKDVPELQYWSVVLAGLKRGSQKTIGPCPIVPVERSRFPGTDNIGALVDWRHWVLDLPGVSKNYTNEAGNFDKNKMLQSRTGSEARGLLLIYLIDKDSRPRPNSKTKVELFEDYQERKHVVGLAISFPQSPTELPGKTFLSNLGVQNHDSEAIKDD